MSKTVVISQSNYIPWKGYFDMISRADEFVIYDEVQFTKRDWRNRNKIKTPQGLLWLTIPVSTKSNYTQKISETKISDPEWAPRHLKSIDHAYRQAAAFSTLRDSLADLYAEAGTMEHLSGVNEMFLRWTCARLDIGTKFSQSSDYQLAEDRNERLLSICLQMGATHYLSGPAARDYLDVDRFGEAGVAVEWMSYAGYPEYPQMHGGFEHSVSILDLLLNLGQDAKFFYRTHSPTESSQP